MGILSWKREWREREKERERIRHRAKLIGSGHMRIDWRHLDELVNYCGRSQLVC